MAKQSFQLYFFKVYLNSAAGSYTASALLCKVLADGSANSQKIGRHTDVCTDSLYSQVEIQGIQITWTQADPLTMENIIKACVDMGCH